MGVGRAIRDPSGWVAGWCEGVALMSMWAHILQSLANHAEMQKLDPGGKCELILYS